MALLQPNEVIYHHPLDSATESLQSDVWAAGVKPDSTVNFAAAKLSSGLAPKVLYDPDLGTVPDSQGWTLIEASGPTAASVSGGVLTSIAATNAEQQFWIETGLGGFNLATDEFELEFDLKIITATTLDDGTRWRTGWLNIVEDANLRGFFWGVSDTGVRLSNDVFDALNANSTAFVATATTDDFHKYRLSVSGGIGRLFKDGTELASIGIGAAGGSVANRILFGPVSSLTAGDTRMRKILFPSSTLTGTGGSYPSVVGSTKLAYTGWMKNPSA